MNRKLILPIALILVFALTRIPGVLPQNFSAAYALAFCAGVFFPKKIAWWLPLVTLLVTDMLINVFFYNVPPIAWFMLPNYIGFAAIVLLGRYFSRRASLLLLCGGGILAAILFYVITNTAAWLELPYHKTFLGWLQALTTGLPGYPPTWEFFRNTLLSGGLFTGLFVGAMKATEEKEESEEESEAEEPEAEPAAGESEPAK